MSQLCFSINTWNNLNQLFNEDVAQKKKIMLWKLFILMIEKHLHNAYSKRWFLTYCILYIHFDLFLQYINCDTLCWYLFYSLLWILPCSHFGQWECGRAESYQWKFTFRGTEPDRDRVRDPPRIPHSVHAGTASSLYAPHAGHTVGRIHAVPVQEEVRSSPCLTHTHTHWWGF